MTYRRILVAGSLSLALLAAACHEDELFTPLPPAYAGGAMFARYVSFGNSITAGFQSGGLNDSLQRLAYPVLLARAMGTTFYYPRINYVPTANLFGCPSPITFIFTNPPTRLGPPTAPPCSLRSPNLPPYLNNVAFPGADVLELLNTNYAPPQPPPSATDAYKLFLLGGRTELQRAREVSPTFVTVWIGNNDVLSAILDTGDAGQAADITPPATFTTRLNAPLHAAERVDADGSTVRLARAGVFRRAGRHPHDDGAAQLPRIPAAQRHGHRVRVRAVPLRRAHRRQGCGRRGGHARLQQLPRHLGAGSRQHDQYGRAIQRDDRPSGRCPRVGLPGSESVAESVRGRHEPDSPVPALPTQPRGAGFHFRERAVR